MKENLIERLHHLGEPQFLHKACIGGLKRRDEMMLNMEAALAF